MRAANGRRHSSGGLPTGDSPAGKIPAGEIPAGEMRFLILGRMAVHDGHGWTHLGAAKWRAVLAYLLIHANRFVSADSLIAELWGERVPSSAAKSLQVYVYRLRRALGPRVDLLTRPGGYELAVASDAVDAGRFAALAGHGREALAAGRTTAAVDSLTAALSLWRGHALADVPSTATVLAEAERLAERRLDAWEDLADAKLAAGRHTELVADLRTLVASHPLREPLWAKLMTALHRSGRRSDALTAYAAARRTLVAETGVEPGSELQRVYQAILTDDPVPVGPASPAGRTPVCQLPSRVPDFVGRRDETARVRQLLGGDAPTAPTVVVTGKAGVGKSTFAVHTAHLMRDAFPDGQLHADLRTADNRPADAGDVLASLLKTLGVTGAEIPDGVADRARRYRAELADRRALLVLDNATDERQVRPLLPGAGASAVLVTSRGALAGLEGASRIALDVLSDDEAGALLAADGRPAAGGTPATTRRLIRLCGNLPLALRIAGARLATRPHLSADRLADALSDERRRLDELVAGDLEVRASLGLSYEALPAPARRIFRLMGLLNTPTIPGWVVGALPDCDPRDAERAIDILVDNHLLEVQTGPHLPATREPRYRLHDLVRLYARERADAAEPPPARMAALRRVCEAYLAVAQRADRELGAGFLAPAATPPPPWQPGEAVVDQLLASPVTWFDTERTALCALLRQATDAGLTGVAWRLAAAMATYFEIAGHFDDWRDTHQLALVAATTAADRPGEAVLTRNLGELHTVLDRYDDAVDAFQRSLRAYRGSATDNPATDNPAADNPAAEDPAVDDPGVATAHAGLGVLFRLQGRYGEAAACLQRAIASAHTAGNARAAAYAHCGLVSVHLERGEVAHARREAHQALLIAEQAGYRNGEASARRCLGLAELAAARLDTATGELTRARAVAGALGDQVSEVHALHWLGHIADLRGDVAGAERILGDCLAAYRRFGERFGEALTLRTQADLHLHAGRRAHAMITVRRSLALWRRLRSPYWTARTLDLLAAAHEAGGEHRAAHEVHREAAALRTGAGLAADLCAHTIGTRQLGGHLHRPTARHPGSTHHCAAIAADGRSRLHA